MVDTNVGSAFVHSQQALVLNLSVLVVLIELVSRAYLRDFAMLLLSI